MAETIKEAVREVFEEFRIDIISEAKKAAKEEVNSQVNEIAEVFASQINIQLKDTLSILNDNINKLYLDNRNKLLSIEKLVNENFENHEVRIKALEERDMLFTFISKHGWKILLGLIVVLGSFVFYELITL